MTSLTPPLSTLEQAIERELTALEDNRNLPVPLDVIPAFERDKVDAFASSFRADLSDDSLDEEHIEETARKLIQDFLDEFGSDLLREHGFQRFQESIVPGLKAVVERITR